VDQDIGAHRPGAIELLLAARGHKDSSPRVLGDLQCGQRHAAADAENEDRLTWQHPGLGHHHPPGGKEHQGKGGGVLEAQALRDGPEVDFGNHDRLRVGAVTVLAEDLPAVAQAVLAAGAVVAGAVAQPRVEEDPGTGWIACRAGTVRRDHARAVGAADVGEGDFRDVAVACEEVQVVEGGRPKRDQDLTGARLRSWRVLVAEHLGAAVLVKSNRLHVASCYSFTRLWRHPAADRGSPCGLAERKSQSVTLQYRNLQSRTWLCQKS